MVDSTAPTVPALDYAKAVSPIAIELRWLGSYDAVGTAAYKVYRDNSLVVTLGTQTFWVDPGLTANTAYTYEVSALDAALNESGRSNKVVVSTLIDPNAAATATVAAPAKDHGFAEIDFGTTPVENGTFIILDPEISVATRIVAKVAYDAPTGKDQDEVEMDDIMLRCVAGAGKFTVFAHATDGSFLADKFKINYTAS